jgi:cyclopropane fatty-acyl-phospholipid synthase-like methyltransferase
MVKKSSKLNLNNILNFKNNIIYNITLIIAILWILLTIIKKYFPIYFIQRNTIAMYLLIFIGLSLSKYFFNNLWFSIPLIILIFILHEIAWYGLYIGFTKDEGEVTNNFYSWANIYCNNTLKKDITNNNNNDTDYSEGLFDNNWNLNNEESFKLKFDTYFEYLKLKPGMKILDIGCGNGHWLQYCKNKGVEGLGVTISESQYKHNMINGLNVILGDVHKGILKTINQKFDAITCIGALEHMCSLSNKPKKNIEILNNYYNQVKNLINPNSESRLYLNSYMTTNKKYSKYLDVYWFINAYFITTAYGYGAYVFEEDIEKIYNSENSKILIKRDYTEDYRWILVRDNDSWGYCNYKFDTPYRIANFVKDVFTDPSWWQRFLYGYFDSWLWQFGGTNPEPMPENKDTPIRSYIYVTEITP